MNTFPSALRLNGLVRTGPVNICRRDVRLILAMIDAGLNKKYSVEGLFTELEKIKTLVLPDGEKITTEITKKQLEILDALKVCA